MTEFTVELTRTIAAPRDEVYRALVDPARLVRWMIPPGCEPQRATVDERAGGRHRVEYLSSDGTTHAFDSVIQELVPDERIVLDFAFEGSGEGQRLDDTVLTLSLSDAPAGGTEIRLVHTKVTLTPPVDPQSVNYGWGAALDKLEAVYERSTT
jgi:uncharacterized protein YndB with AHSA1/START domain